MTWRCFKCGWGYPDTVPSEPVFFEGTQRGVCALCVGINPARFTRTAARDFELAHSRARQARLDGTGVPPPVDE